mmetsp:Transcript_3344/g.6288  ORF Transcript_3344/g.6288 Transcript_3344/m.6288 type:complete len:200 (+) Transcript_3344:562-1161(+)
MRFKSVQLEQAICCRIEFDMPNPSLYFFILDSDFGIFHEAWIHESTLLSKVQKVVPIESTAQTLTKENWIAHKLFWDTSRRVDIREIHLSTWLEDTERLAENCFLVRGKVHHAIGYNNIHRLILDPNISKPLDVSPLKNGIGLLVSKLVCMPPLVILGHRNLLLGHINPDHTSTLPYHLSQDVAIPTSSTSEIQNTKSV